MSFLNFSVVLMAYLFLTETTPAIAENVFSGDYIRDTRATQDNWIDVLPITEGENPTSELFADCLDSSSSPTVQYKPASVLSPSTGITYSRSELNGFGKGPMPATWNKQIQTQDIFACADAAEDYRLFKYDGKTCYLSNASFPESYEYMWDGPDEGSKNEVFINHDMPPASCLGDGERIFGEAGPCVNIIAFPTPQFLEADYSFCENNLDDTVTYYHTSTTPLPTLQNYLRTKKITGDYIVYASYSYMETVWDEANVLVDPAYLHASSFEGVMEKKGPVVITSDLDYMLLIKYEDDPIYGIICMTDF